MNFVEGELLLVDKPLHWTSFDVVNKIRISLKPLCGKIKVGHAGTLDPLATGLLLICTGKKTKEIEALQSIEKAYTGTIMLGATTPTYDAEMEPDAIFPISHIHPQLIANTVPLFSGKIEQIPPQYSAIKVGGKKAYSEKRKGNEIALKAREIEIFDFQITAINLPEITFYVKCSKGTYIRSLAHDFGKALNSGAYLSSLCRVSIGDYKIENAWKLADLTAHIDNLAKAPQNI